MRWFFVCAAVWSIAAPAAAFRPFNSTDASIAARGEIEIECGPVGYLVDAGDRFVVVPSAILNVGVADGWEMVVEGRNFVLVNAGAGERRDTFRDSAVSTKGMLRRGSLQDRTGPSVAFEAGLLLPTFAAEHGVGASFAGIVSQRWSALTLHVNGALVVTHDHGAGEVLGAIVEGPSKWILHPVAEVTIEQDDGRTASGLVGAILRV